MVDPWRVAQIAVELGPDYEGARGSGYLIAPGRVLTAAHVVTGAVAIRVRLDLGKDAQIDVLAESWWADPEGHEGTDLAVITIPQAATGGRTFEQARFGRISDCTAVLKLEAFGFPLFKLRGDPRAGQGCVFRDFEHVVGHCPVAANRRQGTLAVYLDAPPPREPPKGEPSPWEGMSGGPVLAGGRIVGVVAEHHSSEGTGRLTARRIDRAYKTLAARDLSVLAKLLGLTPTPDGLPDVVPGEPAQLVRSSYLAQVRDIAPDLLIDRDDDLAHWATFCAGTDAYAWWQAGPWSGKSALASWFALHPPAGVDVVSFFITGRLSGQADSDAFLNAMIEQLGALNPGSERFPSMEGARAGAWWDLLASAAANAEERGRRLVVIVDGLDEDEAGATPRRGRPSIASLLPRRPPPGVRFIVTSRSDPGLPDDLPADHPLRHCRAHRLTASEVAKDIELQAKQELRELLAGDQVAVDVIGYVAGAGGGLNRADLSALTEAPPHKLDQVLRGVSGRSLSTRASTDPRDPPANPATRVFLFAHDTLRDTAEERLGTGLAPYREKVHAWIRSYSASGWPNNSPGYAILGYLGLLTRTADVARLSAFARDPRRHAFLLDVTGSDYTALSEIATALSLLSGQETLNLKALVELAAYRLAIFLRKGSIPDDLPVVWALLGRFDHAEAIARTMANPYERATTLTSLATAAAEAGDPDRARQLAADAEAIARTITNPERHATALTSLATAAAEVGNPDRAEAIARTITDPERQVKALSSLVTAAARAGDVDRARRLAADAEVIARTITKSERARALTSLITAASRAGDVDRARRLATDAEAIARTITNPYQQDLALISLITATGQAGDPDRAEAIASTINGPQEQGLALSRLVSAIAGAGELDRAEAIARTITDPERRAPALISLVSAAAEAGDPDRARQLAADAEAIARTMTSPERRATMLASLVAATARAGDLDRAEAIANPITSPRQRATALTSLALATARAGDLDRAEAIARTITNPYRQATAITGLAAAAAEAGDPDRARQLAAGAEAIARTITNPGQQATALTSLVTAIAEAGNPDYAEAIARTINDAERKATVLTNLATAAARDGDPDHAEAIARTITNHYRRARALTSLVAATAWAGDLDRARRLAADAETIARTITHTDQRARALTGLITATAEVGDPHRARRLAADAEAIARTITGSKRRARALTSLAIAAAEAGDRARARRLAVDAEAIARTITMPGQRATALTSLVTAAARAGDPDRASLLAADAEAIGATITDPDRQATVLTNLVTATAQAGDPDRAEAIARTISSRSRRARALISLATATAEDGDPGRAARALADMLVVGAPDIAWIASASRLFPSCVGDVCDILTAAYPTPT